MPMLARARSRAVHPAVLALLAIPLAACGASAPEPAGEDPTEAAAASPAATVATVSEETLEFGPLEPGVRYVIEGSPSISFVSPVETTAFPSGGGARLSFGDVVVLVATGITDVYVGRGDQEPIGDDVDSVLEAFARNERIAISDTGTADLGGVEVAYADFTLPFDANVEGGTPIFSSDASPVFLNDLTANRAFLVESGDGLGAVIVSGPEDAGVDAALAAVIELLASVEVGSAN